MFTAHYSNGKEFIRFDKNKLPNSWCNEYNEVILHP